MTSVNIPKIPYEEQTLDQKLRFRAAVRRSIRSETDRLAVLLEEAANRIAWLEDRVCICRGTEPGKHLNVCMLYTEKPPRHT